MEKLPFYNPELARYADTTSRESLKTAILVLDDEYIRDEISLGNITLAMVRPHVGPNANVLGLSDEEAAESIEELIQLGIVAKFAITLTPPAVEAFYGGDPKDSMSHGAPLDTDRYTNRWEEFADFMASGPSTVLLLRSPNNDAIERWRDQLGHWNIDKHRDPQTIRGRLGVNNFNNLVHGSDAPASVEREIGIIRQCVLSQLSNLS